MTIEEITEEQRAMLGEEMLSLIQAAAKAIELFSEDELEEV